MRTVTIRYFPGCPHWHVVSDRVRETLDRLGLHAVEVRHESVETAEDAARLGFRGSPTILVDGTDLFPTGPASPGLFCRLYATNEGATGSPTVDDLISAFDETSTR
jgi:hypothetical protein